MIVSQTGAALMARARQDEEVHCRTNEQNRIVIDRRRSITA